LHDLIPLGPALPGALTMAEIELPTNQEAVRAVLRGILSAVNLTYRRPSRSQPPP
jgi:hypothetical protein